MAPILLRHLAQQLAQVTRFSLNLSLPSASVYRGLCSLTSAPTRLLMLPGRVTSLRAPVPASLLGQCQHLAFLQPSAGMKTKSAVKRRCKDCFIVRRRGHLCVFCKTNPRHKQRQG